MAECDCGKDHKDKGFLKRSKEIEEALNKAVMPQVEHIVHKVKDDEIDCALVLVKKGGGILSAGGGEKIDLIMMLIKAMEQQKEIEVIIKTACLYNVSDGKIENVTGGKSDDEKIKEIKKIMED